MRQFIKGKAVRFVLLAGVGLMAVGCDTAIITEVTATQLKNALISVVTTLGTRVISNALDLPPV